MSRNPRPADGLRVGDAQVSAPASAGARRIGGVAGWIDDRTSAGKSVNYLLKKVFPDHWTFMLGEIAMYSLIVCLISGAFLTLWFVPSMGHTVYDGSYGPLKGITMSEAYASTLNISFDVRGGLIIRQIHHWAALMFVVAIVVHMFRVFFTGAFRKPRELNWVIGSILALLAIVEGFAGYSLPDDLLSGTGIRAMEGFVQSAPIIGSYLSWGIFGGPFPGEMIIPRLYSAHVLLIPAILVGLFTAHIVMVAVNKHTQYPGPGKTNSNVVGFPVMPVYAAKAGGFFFIVFGVITLIASLIQINGVWGYGPYDPSPVTAGSQPDWYMGFADGALRLTPGWLEFNLWNTYTLSLNIALGSLVLLPLVYGLLAIYPFVERFVTGDDREHHLLQKPYNAPTRAGIGAFAITAYTVFMFGAGNDIMAIKLGMSINDITHILQVSLFVMPPLMFWCTKRICISLQRRDRDMALHQRESGTIIRTPEGGYFERHDDFTEFERWGLVQEEAVPPLELPPAVDENGVARKGSGKDRLRARLYRFYFKDHVNPVTPAELAAAHHDGQAHEAIEPEAEREALEGSRKH